MRFITTRARSLQPDIGLIGIYQAFALGSSPNWKNKPTPEQVREDMLSFYEWNADGVMAFIYHWDSLAVASTIETSTFASKRSDKAEWPHGGIY